jgi:hypothetical protein
MRRSLSRIIPAHLPHDGVRLCSHAQPWAAPRTMTAERLREVIGFDASETLILLRWHLGNPGVGPRRPSMIPRMRPGGSWPFRPTGASFSWDTRAATELRGQASCAEMTCSRCRRRSPQPHSAPTSRAWPPPRVRVGGARRWSAEESSLHTAPWMSARRRSEVDGPPQTQRDRAIGELVLFLSALAIDAEVVAPESDFYAAPFALDLALRADSAQLGK